MITSTHRLPTIRRLVNPKVFKKIIAVDFDGTLCENKWPNIGRPNMEVINYILEEQRNGARLILWTNRTDIALSAAVLWCYNYGIMFDAINENLPDVIEYFKTESRKIFAHEYIDDRMCTRFKLPFVSQKKEESNEKAS